jgi:glycosyltransferase involved in cell wall biosynthesis
MFKRMATLFRYTLGSNADITLLAGFERPEYWLQLLLLRLKRRKIAVFCDSTIYDRKQSAIRGFLKTLFFRSVDGIFCYGVRSREYVIQYGANPQSVFKRCQAAALTHDYSRELALKQRMEMAPSVNAPRYLYVGRLSPEKDLDTLLLAFSEVIKHHAKATLVLIGSGPDRAKLEKQVLTLGLQDKVIFEGSKSGDELFKEYSKSTCLVLPSISEPWGLVVNEALSYGAPAIVSNNCGCVPELVIDGKTGFVHKTSDVGDLAQKMIAAPTQFYDLAATANECLELIATFSSEAAASQILLGLRQIMSQNDVKQN